MLFLTPLRMPPDLKNPPSTPNTHEKSMLAFLRLKGHLRGSVVESLVSGTESNQHREGQKVPQGLKPPKSSK